MPNSPQPDKRACVTLRIVGMTCASCEILLERKLKAVAGVHAVHINHRTGIATIESDIDRAPCLDDIAAVIRKAGYALADDAETMQQTPPDTRRWMEIGGSLLIIFALYHVLKTFDLVSLAPSTSGALSIGGIFLIGLVAGTSSCLAVTGGLLLALAAKHNELNGAKTRWEKFQPLLQFNIGRIVSYFILGGMAGLIGTSITLSTRANGYMNILVAFIMLWLALGMLGIIPKGRFFLRPPKKLSHWIHSLSESNHPIAPFMLGAFTFFLPCGFTQSLQFVALASGSFSSGALIMSVFALGTLPTLLGLSALSSSVSGNTSRLFLRFSGALVLVLALFNLQNGSALSGINLARAIDNNSQEIAPIINGNTQDISMRVTSNAYVPNQLTIKAGIPVRWHVDGSQAYGCTSILTIPSMGISKPLSRGENIIEFTAPSRGPLAFMCSMGMVRGSFNVL